MVSDELRSSLEAAKEDACIEFVGEPWRKWSDCQKGACRERMGYALDAVLPVVVAAIQQAVQAARVESERAVQERERASLTAEITAMPIPSGNGAAVLYERQGAVNFRLGVLRIVRGDTTTNGGDHLRDGEPQPREDSMSEPQRFRKKPVVIEAIQYHGGNAFEIQKWAGAHEEVDGDGQHTLVIPTLEGDHRADLGDWIIKGVAGEFYPCKPAIFDATYEPADA